MIIHYPEDEGKIYRSFRYPAGEVQVRILPDKVDELKGAGQVILIARLGSDIMPFVMLSDAIISCCLNGVFNMVFPYLPYSRADRMFVSGDCFGLSVFADILNTIAYDSALTLDVHSAVSLSLVPYLENVSPKGFQDSVIASLDHPVILLPDKGARDRFTTDTDSIILHCEKDRDVATGELKGFIVPKKEEFQGKPVLIVDDICDGGATFLGIAKAMQDYGLELDLAVTHGIFSKGLDELAKVFKNIYTTDSITPTSLKHKSLTIIPCEGMILKEVLDESELWKLASK